MVETSGQEGQQVKERLERGAETRWRACESHPQLLVLSQVVYKCSSNSGSLGLRESIFLPLSVFGISITSPCLILYPSFVSYPALQLERITVRTSFLAWVLQRTWGLLWLLKMAFVKLAEPTGTPVNSQFPAVCVGASSHQVLVPLLGICKFKVKVNARCTCGILETWQSVISTVKLIWLLDQFLECFWAMVI